MMPAPVFRFHIPTRTLIALALCLAMLASACGKKVVKSTPPVLVPSIETQPQTVPEPQPAAAGETTPAPESVPATQPEKEAQKPKPKPRKPVARKTVPAEPLKPEPVPQEAAKPEPAKPAEPDASVQITADVPRAAVQSQTQNTEQLLRNSEAKLRGLSRSLSDSEQAMARQARNYIAQSNQALQAGDFERAYNLAVKASLLANELAK
jgi:outer membrane biosynthesis protein TonB